MTFAFSINNIATDISQLRTRYGFQNVRKNVNIRFTIFIVYRISFETLNVLYNLKLLYNLIFIFVELVVIFAVVGISKTAS